MRRTYSPHGDASNSLRVLNKVGMKKAVGGDATVAFFYPSSASRRRLPAEQVGTDRKTAMSTETRTRTSHRMVIPVSIVLRFGYRYRYGQQDSSEKGVQGQVQFQSSVVSHHLRRLSPPLLRPKEMLNTSLGESNAARSAA